MSRALRVARGPNDGAADILRLLADALAPLLLERLEVARRDAERVDVLAAVPGPKRTILRACRSGAISGASKIGRRWLAPRSSVDAWLRELGPRLVAPQAGDDEDELEPLRRRLAGAARPAKRAG